jgi:hypothetical protein
MKWYSPKTHKFGFTGAHILAVTIEGELRIMFTDTNCDGQMFSDREGGEFSIDEILCYTPIRLPIFKNSDA